MTLARLLPLIVAVTAAAEPARAATGNPVPVRGVALGLFAEDAGWSYQPLLAEIARTGADHVALVVAWYQDNAASSELYEHPRYTAPSSAVATAVRDARALGLTVTLFPIVRLAAPRTADEWRGTLQPADRAAWWQSYRTHLIALARLAGETGAAVLSVGSELSRLDGAADRPVWAALVAELHRIFPGRLAYSGNWDHFDKVAIYDLVDDVGVCGYFALALAGAPSTIDDLVRGWRDARMELSRFARARGRPIVFTEIGYRSIRGVAAAPWDEGAPGEVDLDEQRRCYEAFRRVWRDAPADVYAGAYFWNWYGWGGPTSRGYTPRGKPASDELRRFFSR
jgi:hypothetical protein